MNKRQYFIEALQADAYLRKEWIISTFSLVLNAPSKNVEGYQPYPYEIIPNPDDPKGYYFADPNNGLQLTKIDDAERHQALFSVQEHVTLKPGDLKNVKQEINTRYGNALVNAMLLVWPFGDKIPFMTGRIKGKAIESMVAAKLTDTPEPGAPRDPTRFYVDELLKMCEAAGALGGISTVIGVPGASKKTMTIDPAIPKRRDELLKQHAHELHDPAIMAKIEGELTAMDRAWLKGDTAEEFYIKDATIDVSRKRCFIAVGAETGFGDSSKGINPITTSLQEGWDMARMPQLVDNLRHGSYGRGKQTAMGGESVKYFYRIFQNTRVAEDDCGTTEGLDWVITADTVSNFVGLYQAGTTKGSPSLTEDQLKAFIGKKIKIRSPMLCKTEAPSFCARCVGDSLASSPTGLHIAASDVGSTFMNIFMKAMHGKALKVARYDFKTAIT